MNVYIIPFSKTFLYLVLEKEDDYFALHFNKLEEVKDKVLGYKGPNKQNIYKKDLR